MTRLRRLSSISSQEWKLLRTALPLVVTIRLALWLLPSRAVVAAARRIAADAPRSRAPGVDPAAITWAVQAAAARVPRASCLTQALAARLLLLRHGFEAELCVGVARDAAGAFRAHAWLEHAGAVIIGGDQSLSFTRLPDLSRAGALRGAGGSR